MEGKPENIKEVIKNIIESDDPSLDEPAIYELIITTRLETEVGRPDAFAYAPMEFQAIGEKITRGGSIPRTRREIELIRLLDLTRGINKDYNGDPDRQIKEVSQTLNFGYREGHIDNCTRTSQRLELKPVEELTDEDRRKLAEKRAKIEEIKHSQDVALDEKGLLFGVEATARQALLALGEIEFQEKFKTYRQLKEETSRKSGISFNSIKKAVAKFLGRGDER